MTFVPTPGAVRTDMQFTMSGQQIHNVFWFARNESWTEEQREALNTALAAWWDTNKSYFSTSMGLVQITTVNQESASAPSSTLVVSPIVYGTTSGGSMPNNVATCVTLRTDLRGRSYRGRTYLAGMPKATQLDEVLFTTQWIANAVIVLTALKDAIEALGAVWVVVSKVVLGLQRAAGLKTPITAIAADQYIDSQRRRLGLRGV